MDPNQVIHVAGFVDIKSYPKVDPSLILDPTLTQHQLPLSHCIPLNVEHIENAEVGHVWALYMLEQGLFCLAVITSKDFLNLLDCLYSESASAQNKLNNLPSNPRIEMLHAWLPELSLASLNPSNIPPSAEAPVNFFHHVSLCALGKRRGTTAIYGNDLKWTLDKFSSMDNDTKNKIIADYVLKKDNSDMLAPVSFSPNYELLMAKAIDAGFLKDRLNMLKIDKSVACVTSDAYLKASSVPVSVPASGSLDTCSKVTSAKAHIEPNTVTKNSYPLPLENMMSGNPGGAKNDTDKNITIPEQLLMSLLQKNFELTRTAQTQGNTLHPNSALPSNVPWTNFPPTVATPGYHPPLIYAGAQPSHLPSIYDNGQFMPLDPTLSRQLMDYYGLRPRSLDKAVFQEFCRDSIIETGNLKGIKRKREFDECESVFPGEHSMLINKNFCHTKTAEEHTLAKQIGDLVKSVDGMQREMESLKTRQLTPRDVQTQGDFQRSMFYSAPAPQIVYSVPQQQQHFTAPHTANQTHLNDTQPPQASIDQAKGDPKPDPSDPKQPQLDSGKTTDKCANMPSVEASASAPSGKCSAMSKKLKNMFCDEVLKK